MTPLSLSLENLVDLFFFRAFPLMSAHVRPTLSPPSCPPPSVWFLLPVPPIRPPHGPWNSRTVQSGFPYVAVFLRKEPEWNQAAAASDGAAGATGEAGGGAPAAKNKEGVTEGSAENAVQQTFPEVITSLDEIHEVGTLAQVRPPVKYRAWGWGVVSRAGDERECTHMHTTCVFALPKPAGEGEARSMLKCCVWMSAYVLDLGRRESGPYRVGLKAPCISRGSVLDLFSAFATLPNTFPPIEPLVPYNYGIYPFYAEVSPPEKNGFRKLSHLHVRLKSTRMCAPLPRRS